MNMESLAELLEQELEETVEVKNKKSLHRFITLLTEGLAQRERNDREHSEFREAVIRIDTRIEEGFKRMDERFEAIEKRFEAVDKRFEAVDKRFEAVDKRFETIDKRFDDMNQRFSMMFRFITIGFVILATMMSVFQFLG